MSCSICIESIDKTNMIKTPCDHTFCNKCLTKWLITNTSCPMCRNNFGPSDKSEESDDDDEEISINVEMNDGISKRFQSDIEEYYEDFVDRLFDMIDNIEDQEYLRDYNVLIENGYYCMNVEFIEKNKVISSLISYDPSTNSANFYYGLRYKNNKRHMVPKRINKNINNRGRMGKQKFYK